MPVTYSTVEGAYPFSPADLQRLLDVTPGDAPARRVYAEAWAETGDAARATKERENARRVQGPP